ncbi:hypothetical protein KDA_15850 [Dictyobacter alpinus]|uniref:Protein-glutamine gamma-glutamyltransferase-like C-terminal domain-containing protein n=1 Tax=Dictyobacter alpinus TaxID=2014873 RepID=A0A402B431_9CHLR|nr:DUF4129 domain-containing protein [Dictyobacter alpinus]GCE26101.1 hypothetical protein KDA_15850 [Dictyobacter alpinus]
MQSTPQMPDSSSTDGQPQTAPRSLADVMTWGEQLLPLSYVALEASWISILLIGLGRLHVFGLHQPFMPLWAPFLLLIISTWGSLNLPDQALKQQKGASQKRHSGILSLTIQCVCSLFIIWASLYSSTIAFWNPTWIGQLLTDFIQINGQSFTIVGILLMCYILCRRGIHIARYLIEPEGTMRGIITGGIVSVCVCLTPSTSGQEQVYLLLLILLFFVCALLARSLAYAIFVRQEHLSGLQGSKFAQDRLITITVGLICLVFGVLTLLLGATISPSLLAVIQQSLSPLGTLYNGFAYGLAWFMTLLVRWIPIDPNFKFSLPKLNRHQPPVPPPSMTSHNQVSPEMQTLGGTISIILFIVFIIALVWIVTILLRKRRGRKTRQFDLHESLWSWQLFWTQFKAFLLSLWHRLRASKKVNAEQVVVERAEEGETAVKRDIRAIYRAFLQWSAGRGYARQRDETPFEFKRRLDLPLVDFEPEIQVVTEVYTAARYGQTSPGDQDVERMQQNWMSLQQKSHQQRE